MSDLFDRVAMRALGSEANLRLRPRTRFEPMIAPEIAPEFAPKIASAIAPGVTSTASTDQPLSIDDDPLAAGATPPTTVVGENAPDAGAAPSERGRSPPLDAITTLSEPMPRDPGGADQPREELFLGEARLELPAERQEGRPPARPARMAAPATANSIVSPRAVATPPASDAVPATDTSEPPPPLPPLPRQSIAVAAASPTARAVTSVVEATVSPPPRTSPAARNSDGAPPNAPTLGELAPAPRNERTREDPLGVQARSKIERLSPVREASAVVASATPAPIEITIGRLEIRAEAPAAQPRAAKPFAPHVDLAAYRARKDRGS